MDAVVHARAPGLLPEIQALIGALPDRAYIERSVYHQDAARSGLLPTLDAWRRDGLLRDPLDYRNLPDGDRRFRQFGDHYKRSGLSRQDLATLVLAATLGDCAVLTGERLLTQVVRRHGLFAIDLFDIVRFAMRAGRMSRERARGMCAEWDRNQFSAGRPIDYAGNFDQELKRREAIAPLPL